MNINANEILLLKQKNLKFKGEEGETVVTQPTMNNSQETSPETIIDAMDSEGKNNLTFQGVKIPANIRKKMAPMMALALIGGGLSSCTKEVVHEVKRDPIYIENSFSVDFSAITEMYNQMFAFMQAMVEQQKLTYEQMILLNTQMQQFLEMYKNDKLNQEEYFNKMYALMLENNANQQLYINMLIAQGKTQEEAKKLIQELITEVKNGNSTAAQAYEKLLKELGIISGLLDDIKAKLDSIQTNMNDNHEEYMAAKNIELELLIKSYKLGLITKEQLDALIKNTDDMKKNLETIKGNTYKLIDICKDDTKFNELMDLLKNNHSEYKAMFEFYGLKMEDVVKMSASELQNALKTFMTLYIETEAIENEKLSDLYKELKRGNIDAKMFYGAMFDHMIRTEQNQHVIINQLIKNGKTEKEANRILKEILDAVKAGNLQAHEAYELLMKELGNISEILGDIKAQLDSIQNDMNANHEEYMAAKKAEINFLIKIYNQGQINKNQLDKLIKNTNDMRNNLETIKGNTYTLIEICKDDTKFNELMDLIKNNHSEYKAMFEFYGLKYEDLINMTSEKVINKLNEFMKLYMETENKQIDLLISIGNKIDVLEIFPGYDTNGLKESMEALKDAVDKNTNSVDKNTEAVTKELEDISAQLDKIQQTLDSILAELGSLSSEVSTYNRIFAKNWNTALGKIDDLNGTLKGIQTSVNISNDMLKNINKNIEDLETAHYLTNGYISTLAGSIDELKDILNNLKLNGKGGLTINELKEFMEERDQRQYDKFVQLSIDMGFDKLPGDVATIKDLLDALNNKVQEMKDYSNQLNTIINKLGNLENYLKNLDPSAPDYSAKLDKIIKLLEEFKCNCQCGGNAGSNEGIVGDLEDIFG